MLKKMSIMFCQNRIRTFRKLGSFIQKLGIRGNDIAPFVEEQPAVLRDPGGKGRVGRGPRPHSSPGA